LCAEGCEGILLNSAVFLSLLCPFPVECLCPIQFQSRSYTTNQGAGRVFSFAHCLRLTKLERLDAASVEIVFV